MIKRYTAGFATELSIIAMLPAGVQTAVMEQLLRDRLQIPGALTREEPADRPQQLELLPVGSDWHREMER